MENIKIPVKLKLASLWTSVTLCYLYGDYFELYVPDKVQGLISGTNLLDSPTKLFAASILLAIPAIMVFLTVLLKPAISRWLNIIFGKLCVNRDFKLFKYTSFLRRNRHWFVAVNRRTKGKDCKGVKKTHKFNRPRLRSATGSVGYSKREENQF